MELMTDWTQVCTSDDLMMTRENGPVGGDRTQNNNTKHAGHTQRTLRVRNTPPHKESSHG